jgi:hypothetical protein
VVVVVVVMVVVVMVVGMMVSLVLVSEVVLLWLELDLLMLLLEAAVLLLLQLLPPTPPMQAFLSRSTAVQAPQRRLLRSSSVTLSMISTTLLGSVAIGLTRAISRCVLCMLPRRVSTFLP